MIYLFEDCALDTDRRELRRGTRLVAVEPQVFDLLHALVRDRDRVVSKGELLASVWKGRAVSDSALSSRITAARQAIGDSGGSQRLIRTVARKGFRFIADVHERPPEPSGAPSNAPPAADIAVSAARPFSLEKRQLTILACDLVAPGVSAEHATIGGEGLAALHVRIGSVAALYAGHVATYAAGNALVYFGYPEAREDDAERAVRAGLAIAAAASEVAGGPQCRVGIATGPVIVGPVNGADAKRLVTGPPLEQAARFAQSAGAGVVVISADTKRLVGGLFDYADRGAKDRSSADAAFVVRGDPSAVDRFAALRSRRTRFLGRGEELDLLLRRWQQAKAREGRVVLIWGEPGIGKSRLVAEFQAAVDREPHACLRFHCAPHRAQTALHPLISHLEHAAGFETAESGAAKFAKLERLLAQPSAAKEDVALFAELLSLPAHDRHAPPPHSPQRRRELLLERFVARVAAIAARRPVLMILEDAHWIDASTRELIDMTIERLRGLRVLLMVTYRPDFSAPWLGLSHVTTLTLNRLERVQNAAMIKDLAGNKTLPAAVLEEIITRADGIPLFVEELTKSILESGLVREERDRFVLAGPLLATAVPATLQASLVERFDRNASMRALAQVGAALGREFSLAVLKSVSNLDDAKLLPVLDQLVAGGLLHRRGAAPDFRYVFKHALVQDAAYNTLMPRQRTDLHARIVAVLEHEFPDMARGNADILARHCTEAGLWEKAIDYRLKAARTALERSAGIEAHSQVEHAMALLPKIAARGARRLLEGRVQVALGDAMVMTKGFASPDVAAALSRGRDLLAQTRHPIESLRALCGLCNYHLMRSEAPKSLELVRPYLARGVDASIAPIIHFLAGSAELHIGNFEEARARLETSLSLYDEDARSTIAFTPGYHLRSFTLVWLGFAHLYRGALEQAEITIREGVRDARGRSHPFTLVSALLALARFFNHKRDLAGAIKATEEGLAIATEQRNPYHISRANVLRAVNLIQGGQAREGAALMESALVAHRRTGANFQSSFNLSHLALAYAQSGDHMRAEKIAREAIADVRRSGERWWEAEAERLLGEILVAERAKRPAAAGECFRRALTCARRQKAKFWQLRAAGSLARRLFAAGKKQGARRILAPIVAQFDDGRDWPDLAEARDFLKRVGASAR